MQTVKSLAEAKQYFIRNSQDGEKGNIKSTSLKCKKDSRARICTSLEEAAAWYGGAHSDS